MPLFGSTRYEVSKERPDSVPFAEQARAMGELIRSGKVHSPPNRNPNPNPNPNPSLSHWASPTRHAVAGWMA